MAVQHKRTALAPGARQLPTHHVTIRVPWHDNGWDGSVCKRPMANTSCLVLPRIGSGRVDATDHRCAGQRLDQLAPSDWPPCVGEKASFMAPFDLTRTMRHPYVESSAATHGHFLETPFINTRYSAPCVPFRWMLRQKVEGDENGDEVGIAERLKLGWSAEREPNLSFDTAWVQERDNQLLLLDTFFGSLRENESLCFFYAKRTPLSENAARVIVGVGRVLSKGQATEYKYNTDTPPLRCVLWERNVGHSIRPGYTDGFLFPYQALLAKAEVEGFDPEPYLAFAPDDHFDDYSYGSELLNHDGAVASLVACAAALHRIKEQLVGPWETALKWIDTELNRLWKARGAFPGLGSALAAFGYEWGFQHGSLLAYELELMREQTGGNAWTLVDSVTKDPSKLKSATSALLTTGLCKGWQKLPPAKRALLELISRCSISEQQALRMYDATKRNDAGVILADGLILENPYLLFERDRASPDPIPFGAVDRGMFPDEVVRREFPIPGKSCINDPADSRRVRALSASLLEAAASQGHTVLPRSWLIRRAREKALQPPCPLGDNILDAVDGDFSPVILKSKTGTDEVAYQLDRLAECRSVIQREVKGRKGGKPHGAVHDWNKLVETGLQNEDAAAGKDLEINVRARTEKAAALEQLYRSRLSVLLGPAGSGKTTLLRMLCSMPDVSSRGLLLLAPTGKARVRLEEQTQQRGAGRTLAQYLNEYQRYDTDTGAYFVNRAAKKCGDYRTVIVDECSMLTEEQLAALFDSLTNVERFILVGDPRQLPPIGAGRPFVDILKQLAPDSVGSIFPRVAPGYAELTVTLRQKGMASDDVLLASQYSGRPIDPGADEVWDRIAAGGERLKLVQWRDPQDLQAKLLQELVGALKLNGPDDELGFELTLGGSKYEEHPRAFFWNKFGANPGAAAKAEAWQILSPIRGGLEGVDAINRLVQDHFRRGWRQEAQVQGWGRKITKPFGRQAILYGDKVINVINKKRFDVYPKPTGDAYIANGDLGMVVGQYKTKKFKGLPWKLEVEFAGQLGHKYGFNAGEFGDEGANPLELAYVLTVHKTQGSEFGVTFVVLPNPCWLLSRELLYTALTRHKDKLIVLHQGAAADLRRFSGEEYSEISRRMTNLFVEPTPCEVTVGRETRFLEAGLIHRTERGKELVRSKSELVIADKLHAKGFDYAYEQPLVLPNGKTRYPDFTISDHARGVTFYWEHSGMLHDPVYRARWEKKRSEYLAAGIVPWSADVQAESVLLESRDEIGGGLDSARIAELIDQALL